MSVISKMRFIFVLSLSALFTTNGNACDTTILARSKSARLSAKSVAVSLIYTGKPKIFWQVNSIGDWTHYKSTFKKDNVQVYALAKDASFPCDCVPTGTVFIRFHDHSPLQVREAIFSCLGLDKVADFCSNGHQYYEVKCDDRDNPVHIAAILQQQTEVAMAEPDFDKLLKSSR